MCFYYQGNVVWDDDNSAAIALECLGKDIESNESGMCKLHSHKQNQTQCTNHVYVSNSMREWLYWKNELCYNDYV